jgi:LEA14-like dessication related protein
MASLALASCGPALKPPTLRLDKVGVEKARLSGLGLDVFFLMRNPNPDPILVEGMEYDLVINGRRIAKGYYPEVVALGPFAQERILSHLDVNWLSLPGAVRSVFDQDRAQARVDGTFYVRQGSRRGKAIPFDSEATVHLR